MSDHLHDLRILRRQMVASELRAAAESLWSIRDYPAFGEDDIRAAVGILRDMGYIECALPTAPNASTSSSRTKAPIGITGSASQDDPKESRITSRVA